MSKCRQCGEKLPMFFKSGHKCRTRLAPMSNYAVARGIPRRSDETTASDPYYASPDPYTGIAGVFSAPATPDAWSGGGGESGGAGASGSWDSGSSCDSGSSYDSSSSDSGSCSSSD